MTVKEASYICSDLLYERVLQSSMARRTTEQLTASYHLQSTCAWSPPTLGIILPPASWSIYIPQSEVSFRLQPPEAFISNSRDHFTSLTWGIVSSFFSHSEPLSLPCESSIPPIWEMISSPVLRSLYLTHLKGHLISGRLETFSLRPEGLPRTIRVATATSAKCWEY